MIGGRRARRLGQPLPGQQTAQARILETGAQIGGEQFVQREIGAGELFLAPQPLFLEGAVQAVLAAEVVGDELLVHARAVGDPLHTRTRETLLREDVQGGGQQAAAGAFGIALALLRRGERRPLLSFDVRSVMTVIYCTDG